MIITTYDVEKILQAKEFKRSSESTANIIMYWRLKENKEQVVFVCNANRELVFFNKDLLRIRNKAFTDVDDNDVLYVFVGDSWTKNLRGKNSISINANNNSYKKHGCKEFTDVLTSIDAIAKYYIVKTKYRNDNAFVTDYNMSDSPAFAYILIAIFAMVYFMTRQEPYTYAISSQRIETKQYQYLLYYMFAHANLRHLVSNSLALLSIGIAYIKRNGNFKFITMFLLGGIGAGLFSAFGQTNVQTVGASGAIFALLGATVADAILVKECRSQIPDMVLYALLTLVMSSFGYADNYAHIGGMVTGIIFSFLLSSHIKTVDNIKQILFLKKIKKARGSAYGRIYTSRSKDNLSRIYD